VDLFCDGRLSLTVAQSGLYSPQAYPLPAYPVNSYSMQSSGGWYNLATGQYIVQPEMAAVSNVRFTLVAIVASNSNHI